jgi:plastocyanin
MKRLLIGTVLALLVVAGCGGSSSSSSSSSSSTTPAATSTTSSSSASGGGSQLQLSADPQQLKYNTDHLTAKAGKVTITMTNPSPLQHDIAIKGGVNAQGPVVGQGGKSVVSVTLKPGKYTFYCTVDGHESAGMTGELDVN